MYIAGADPYFDDQLGGLALTMEGLMARDRLVFEMARSHDVPVAVTLAGGYARNVNDTVAIHCNTVKAAPRTCRRLRRVYAHGSVICARDRWPVGAGIHRARDHDGWLGGLFLHVMALRQKGTDQVPDVGRVLPPDELPRSMRPRSRSAL